MSRVSSSPAAASTSSIHWTQLYLGIGFTTLATLILELSLTRLFSVVFFYHFAFLAISVALFGMGAGGVFSYVVANRPGNLYAKLGKLALMNAVAVVLVLWFILTRSGRMTAGPLLAVYFASSVPFFLSGTVVSLAISTAIERVDRAYFFDLAGAAAGCLLLIPFLDIFQGPNTVISAAVAFGISAAIWYNQAGEGRRRAIAVMVSLLLVTLMGVNGKTHALDVRWAKGERLPPERFRAWNSFSRVGVSDAGGSWSIRIDADAATGIATFDWDKGLTDGERASLLGEGPATPYILRPNAKVVVIGPGGGWDVSRALASGSKDITAVEINPNIAKTIMQKVMVEENHGIYLKPEVHLHVEDGRSFIRGSREKYQVLQATLVDTWASTAAGAFALSENNLYTSDAFYDYLAHLTDDGVMAFTRWGFDPPRESLRLISLAMVALDRLGEHDVARHVIVLQQNSDELRAWGAQDTVLISRKPLSDGDVATAREFAARSKLVPIYLPGDSPHNAFGQLLTAADPEAFWRNYRYDVSPVGDDRPFFFYTVQPRDLIDFIRHANVGSADFKVNQAVPLLFGLVAVSLIATGIVMVFPRALLGAELPKQKDVLLFLWYFLFLGAGYILVQVALIQKFVLLLGHPTYALTVIVFSMLVSSGIGSFVSRKVVSGSDARLSRVLGVIVLLVAALAFCSAPLTQAAAAWPIAAKIAITALSIAPAAFFMGMPFPSGLMRLEHRHAPSVRWAWSLNAAASVLGSAGAIFLAIYLGLRVTMLIGGALYLCALAVVLATHSAATETKT